MTEVAGNHHCCNAFLRHLQQRLSGCLYGRASFRVISRRGVPVLPYVGCLACMVLDCEIEDELPMGE